MTSKGQPPPSPGERDMHKLHSEYNLEKEPLRTGNKEPRTSLRETAAMGGDQHTADTRMHGWLSAWMMLLIVILAVVAGYYAVQVIAKYVPAN
jgi:hypothetical protein